MKNYLLILFISLTLVSCEKQENNLIEENDPSVTSVEFKCGGAGSNISQVVDVEVVIPDSGSVKKLSMFTKNGNEVYYIENPESGEHRLYNHSITGCTSGVPSVSYYFVFTKQDNTKVITGEYPE